MTASGEPVPTSQWFVTHPAVLPDVTRSALLALENSGQRQFIHHHRQGEPCSTECREVVPSGSSVPGDDQ